MLLGNCSAAGRSGGCKVPRCALTAVVGEGQIKAFPTFSSLAFEPQPEFGAHARLYSS